MSSIRLYLRYISISLSSQMAYPASFILMTLGHFSITFIEFFGVYALFARFEQLGQWGIYEVAIFYGFINMSFAVAEAVGRGYDVFHLHVQRGSFDRILLRPRPLFLQICGTEFQLMRMGRFLQGVVVFIIGLQGISKNFKVIDGLLLLNASLGAILFFLGLMIFQALLSFWSVASLEVVNVFTYGGVQTAQYPIDIYKRWFQRIFIYLIPLGSVSYFPMVSLIREENYLQGFMLPWLGCLFFGIALWGFNKGVKYYCSTGS